MAQVNITLNDKEILQVFTGDREEAMRFLLERILNEIMKAESEEQLKASRHERTEERQDYRNGTRERKLTTRIGTLTLQVPRHRNEPFHTMVFENYSRSEASLIATMVQMVIAGVSTRKVTQVIETLCGKTFSKSTVSELCKRLDEDIRRFKQQPLHGIDAPFLMVDATYFKARENHRIVSKAFMIALAVKSDGHREVVSFEVYDAEDDYSWTRFFEDLKTRGLSSPQVIISDAHKSIRRSMAEIYPEAAWQRCQVHFTRNILKETPTKYKEGLKVELREMFTAKDIKQAREKRDQIIDDYSPIAEKAMRILDEGFEDSMTLIELPQNMQIVLRTTNILERLNRELKRRSDVIQIFPNAASVLRLMGAVTIEYSEKQSMVQRIFSEKTYEDMREKISRDFKVLAKRQIMLLNAA